MTEIPALQGVDIDHLYSTSVPPQVSGQQLTVTVFNSFLQDRNASPTPCTLVAVAKQAIDVFLRGQFNAPVEKLQFSQIKEINDLSPNHPTFNNILAVTTATEMHLFNVLPPNRAAELSLKLNQLLAEVRALTNSANITNSLTPSAGGPVRELPPPLITASVVTPAVSPPTTLPIPPSSSSSSTNAVQQQQQQPTSPGSDYYSATSLPGQSNRENRTPVRQIKIKVEYDQELDVFNKCLDEIEFFADQRLPQYLRALGEFVALNQKTAELQKTLADKKAGRKAKKSAQTEQTQVQQRFAQVKAFLDSVVPSAEVFNNIFEKIRLAFMLLTRLFKYLRRSLPKETPLEMLINGLRDRFIAIGAHANALHPPPYNLLNSVKKPIFTRDDVQFLSEIVTKKDEIAKQFWAELNENWKTGVEDWQGEIPFYKPSFVNVAEPISLRFLDPGVIRQWLDNVKIREEQLAATRARMEPSVQQRFRQQLLDNRQRIAKVVNVAPIDRKVHLLVELDEILEIVAQPTATDVRVRNAEGQTGNVPKTAIEEEKEEELSRLSETLATSLQTESVEDTPVQFQRRLVTEGKEHGAVIRVVGSSGDRFHLNLGEVVEILKDTGTHYEVRKHNGATGLILHSIVVPKTGLPQRPVVDDDDEEILAPKFAAKTKRQTTQEERSLDSTVVNEISAPPTQAVPLVDVSHQQVTDLPKQEAQAVPPAEVSHQHVTDLPKQETPDLPQNDIDKTQSFKPPKLTPEQFEQQLLQKGRKAGHVRSRFRAKQDDEVSVNVGDCVEIIEHSDDLLRVVTADKKSGYIPSNIVDVIAPPKKNSVTSHTSSKRDHKKAPPVDQQGKARGDAYNQRYDRGYDETEWGHKAPDRDIAGKGYVHGWSPDGRQDLGMFPPSAYAPANYPPRAADQNQPQNVSRPRKNGILCRATRDYVSQQFFVREGDYLEVQDSTLKEDWVLVSKCTDGRTGYVPSVILEQLTSQKKTPPLLDESEEKNSSEGEEEEEEEVSSDEKRSSKLRGAARRARSRGRRSDSKLAARSSSRTRRREPLKDYDKFPERCNVPNQAEFLKLIKETAGRHCYVRQTFEARFGNELNVYAGETVQLLDRKLDQQVDLVRAADGKAGYVPRQFLTEPLDYGHHMFPVAFPAPQPPYYVNNGYQSVPRNFTRNGPRRPALPTRQSTGTVRGVPDELRRSKAEADSDFLSKVEQRGRWAAEIIEDYQGPEMTVFAGEVVEIFEEDSDRAYIARRDGQTGYIPRSILSAPLTLPKPRRIVGQEARLGIDDEIATDLAAAVRSRNARRRQQSPEQIRANEALIDARPASPPVAAGIDEALIRRRVPSPTKVPEPEKDYDTPPLRTGKEAQTAFFQDILQKNSKACEAIAFREGVDAKELTIYEKEIFELLDDSRKWWRVRNADGNVGYVPYNFVRVLDGAGFETAAPQQTRQKRLQQHSKPTTAAVVPMKLEASLSRDEHKRSGHREILPSDVRQELQESLRVKRPTKFRTLEQKHAPRPGRVVISAESTPEEVAAWMRQNSFSRSTIECFGDRDGLGLMELTREEFISKVGPYEGRMLANLIEGLRLKAGYKDPREGIKEEMAAVFNVKNFGVQRARDEEGSESESTTTTN